MFSVASFRGIRRPLAAPLASVHDPITAVAAPGNHRAPTPAGRRESIALPASPLDARRSDAVGVALALMVRLAFDHSHRQAGNRHYVAPARLSLVLDLEKPTSLWPANGLTRCPRVDSRDVYRESPVGRAAHS